MIDNAYSLPNKDDTNDHEITSTWQHKLSFDVIHDKIDKLWRWWDKWHHTAISTYDKIKLTT